MDIVFLNNINVEIDGRELLRLLRMEDDDDCVPEVLKMLEEAEKKGRPKAMCGIAYIDARGEDWVSCEGIRFSSRILSVNVKDAHRIFPYVVTCGTELDGWAKSFHDPLERFWADTICEAALRHAFRRMSEDLEERIKPGKTAVMNPGSLDDWPISEQKQLFALMGDRVKEIGVELTESYLMVPVKSLSGIKFPLEFNYENCMLCPRSGCPGRRAEYNERLFNERYAKSVKSAI